VAKAAGTGRGSGTPTPPPGGQRTGARRFVRESWAELRKVQWPTRQQVATGTLVVGIVTAVLAFYVSVVDQIAVRVVRQLNEFLS
jgi:preprotein translocase subunit SecE